MGTVARRLGVAEQTDSRWRREDGGLRVDQAKRRTERERENVRLKKLVADQALDNAIMSRSAVADGLAQLARAGAIRLHRDGRVRFTGLVPVPDVEQLEERRLLGSARPNDCTPIRDASRRLGGLL